MSLTDQSDETLLQAARAGDPTALEELLLRHSGQIFRFGLRMCGDREDAREVLQDSMLAVARSVRTFRGESSLSTWLYSIARSFCIKRRRKSKFLKEQHSLDSDVTVSDLRDSRPAPDDAAASAEVSRAIQDALGEMDPAHREVLVLRDMEGLTAAEVANILGIRVEAVKSRLHRARASLRNLVAPRLGIPLEGPAVRHAGTACPDIVEVFSRNLEGEIDAAACASMERHVESCPRCRTACNALKEVLALCKSSTEVPADIQESVRRALRSVIGAKTREGERGRTP